MSYRHQKLLPPRWVHRQDQSQLQQEQETESTFGGFTWGEGDEMRKSRNMWDEIRGEGGNHPVAKGSDVLLRSRESNPIK